MDRNSHAHINVLSLSFPGCFALYARIFLTSVFINMFVLAIPLFTMNVYDRVLPDFDEPTLIVLTCGVFIALFFDFILKMIRSSFLNRLSSILGQRQEAFLMKHFLSSRAEFSGSVGKNLTLFKELANIRVFWTTRLLSFFFDAPFFIVFIGVIYSLSPVLAAVPFFGALVIILSGLSYAVFGNLSATNKNEVSQKKSNVLMEVLGGLETIQSFNARDEKLDLWRGVLSDEENAQKQDLFFQSLLANFSVLINLSVSVLVLFLGAYEVFSNSLTIGGLIAISILSSRSLAPIIALSPVFSGLKQYQNSRETAEELLREIKAPVDKPLLEKTDVTGALHLQDVSFSYKDQNRQAVQEVSLEVPAGARYGVIGKSGAGKTTLVKMLAGYLTPQSGSVLWDHYYLEAISPEQRSDLLAFSSQEDRFFAGTIADNVFMGSNAAYIEDKARVEKAAYISGLDLVMKQSGFGWDTTIGENGMGLSTGQRQSLSLARALVKDPKILIFDEPLAGMDYALELRLKECLPDYLKGRTFIMVTHRTSLLPLVDHLILMEDGVIKAQGSRDEMMKSLS